MSILYIEPFSGLSGDMFLGALCGLADGYEDILDLPQRLNLEDGKIEIQLVNKNGIVCKHVNIIDLNKPKPSISKSSKNIFKTIFENLFHSHGHEPGEVHSHGWYVHSHQAGEGRSLEEIKTIIDKGNISKSAKKIATEIFHLIGESESRIHDIPLSEMHFHEVSAVDSILDIVGAAVMIDRLGIEKCYADPVCIGYGFVRTQHGILPVPAPATADLLQGIPTTQGEEAGEKVTPTGAAILKWLNPEFSKPPWPITKIAYGPGKKDFSHPNVLRLSILEETEVPQGKPNLVQKDMGELLIVECHVDDMNPEYLGRDFQKEIFALGAKDVFMRSIQMKKGRMGVLLSIIIADKKLNPVSRFLLEHTTSIGLRYWPIKRVELERQSLEIDTPYGRVYVKEVIRPSGRRTRKIEYESLHKISQKLGKPITEIESLLAPFVFMEDRDRSED